MSNQVERSVSNESSFVAIPIPPEESDLEGLEDEAGDKRGAPRASASRGPIYQQTTTSVLVDSLPEFPRLWTRMILDAERGAFVPPLLQEHDFGVLVDAGDLFTCWELTPGEQTCVSLSRGRILEVGAGFGRVSQALRNRNLEVIATDSDPDIVSMYRARGWTDARELTLPDVPDDLGRFDTVIALRGVFPLIGDLDRVLVGLERIRDVLNPGGRLMFTSSHVNTLLLLPDRSPLEYRYRLIYRGYRSPWLRATALPEWLAVPVLKWLGFSDIQILEPSTSEGAGYYAIATLPA